MCGRPSQEWHIDYMVNHEIEIVTPSNEIQPYVTVHWCGMTQTPSELYLDCYRHSLRYTKFGAHNLHKATRKRLSNLGMIERSVQGLVIAH